MIDLLNAYLADDSDENAIALTRHARANPDEVTALPTPHIAVLRAAREQAARELQDANGNVVTIEHFGSEEYARKALASLVNCTNCRNCVSCENCHDCHDCAHCTRCTACNGCVDCVGCTDCTNCTACLNCAACRHCTQCRKCEACTDVTDGHKSVDVNLVYAS